MNRLVIEIVAGVALLAGLAIAWHLHDLAQQKIGEERIAAATLKATQEGQAREAANLIAAYNESQEVLAHVESEKTGIVAENADLLRRIAAYRVRIAAALRPSTVPQAGGDSGVPAGVTPPADVLAGTALEDLAGCSLDYAIVGTQVEGINRLVH